MGTVNKSHGADVKRMSAAVRRRAVARARVVYQGLVVLSWVGMSAFVVSVASYFWSFGVTWTLGPTSRSVGFVRGDLRGASGPGMSPPIQLHWGSAWSRAGTAQSRWRVPFALFALGAFLPVSMAGYRAALAERRARRGLCKRCLYDLSGIELQGGYKVCPECGTTKRVWREDPDEENMTT